jgi:signal transduction histidine kinase/CheY-like chemotaxis protein
MTLLQTVLRIRRQRALGYAIALLLCLLALWVRLEMVAIFDGYPFVTFFVAVLISALLGGLGPGLMAAILCGLFAQYFLIAPTYDWNVLGVSGWVGLGFYAITSASMVALVHGITIAYQGELEARQELTELNETLERRVLERTAELSRLVDERLASENKLLQMQKMEAVGQLTGGIAHDFNNMLAVITGSLDLAMIRAESQEDSRLTRYIGVAQDASTRAASLTARLLAFSRKQALAPQAVDVNRLVEGTRELLARTIGDHVIVDISLSERSWHCFADPAHLESALLNLAINARDAMSDGGTLTIETSNLDLPNGVEGLNPGQYVCIAVSDTGTGMAPDVLERAFDPFFTTKGVGKGTGLGLSQVYGYVHQSGGVVRLQSEVGAGTRIELLLPRFAGQVVSPRAISGEGHPQAITAGAVVLLVEDEEQVRQVTMDALIHLGYTVIPAVGPLEALALLEDQHRVDLLLTDVQMPGMSGKALGSQVAELRPGIPILYMSGYTQEADEAWMAGASLLKKPFSIEQLARATSVILEGRSVSPRPVRASAT